MSIIGVALAPIGLHLTPCVSSHSLHLTYQTSRIVALPHTLDIGPAKRIASHISFDPPVAHALATTHTFSHRTFTPPISTVGICLTSNRHCAFSSAVTIVEYLLCSLLACRQRCKHGHPFPSSDMLRTLARSHRHFMLFKRTVGNKHQRLFDNIWVAVPG